MDFKIKKEVDTLGTWYWTVPQGILNHIIWVWFGFLFEVMRSKPPAYSVYTQLDDAKLHITRWNNGYYKKKYYTKYV